MTSTFFFFPEGCYIDLSCLSTYCIWNTMCGCNVHTVQWCATGKGNFYKSSMWLFSSVLRCGSSCSIYIHNCHIDTLPVVWENDRCVFMLQDVATKSLFWSLVDEHSYGPLSSKYRGIRWAECFFFSFSFSTCLTTLQKQYLIPASFPLTKKSSLSVWVLYTNFLHLSLLVINKGNPYLLVWIKVICRKWISKLQTSW